MTTTPLVIAKSQHKYTLGIVRGALTDSIIGQWLDARIDLRLRRPMGLFKLIDRV